MNILGISAFYHDSAACLVRDGQILAAAQEERFTRVKHDHRFPTHAINYCLRTGGITGRELDYVAFYDKPFLKFERLLQSYLAYAPSGWRSFVQAMPLWLKEKLWLKEAIATQLVFGGAILFPEHHESHAASAFYPSPYQDAAVLTMDGVGEWATTSFGVGEDHRLRLLSEMHFPHSLGLLYSAFTYYTGFKVNSGEYKVMGLAPYGEPRYKDAILSELMDLKDDGSFRLDMRYFNYCAGLTMTTGCFHRLFGGPPRAPESLVTQRDMDLARSIQDAVEEVVLRMARHVRRTTGKRRLCLAGGVALNCVANGKLLREGIFDELWIQPAAGDAGGALGAALLVWHQYLGRPRNVEGQNHAQRGSLLGPEFSDAEIGALLNAHRIPHVRLADGEIPARIAALLAQEKVIGWFQGRMEFGPRALGARSILGDARSPRMQEVMNLKIKFRESFRPFAPAVLAERVGDYFELERESPYMLLVAPVKPHLRRQMTAGEEQLFGLEKLKVVRSTIPAVTHVDYSARIQTVDRQTNPLFYDMIARFERDQGCAVIINTSFNVRGEPIVCTPAEAYRCFMRTHIDYLIMGSYLLDKTGQPPFQEDEDWRKAYVLD